MINITNDKIKNIINLIQYNINNKKLKKINKVKIIFPLNGYNIKDINDIDYNLYFNINNDFEFNIIVEYFNDLGYNCRTKMFESYNYLRIKNIKKYSYCNII
jgi:hypothetical protein